VLLSVLTTLDNLLALVHSSAAVCDLPFYLSEQVGRSCFTLVAFKDIRSENSTNQIVEPEESLGICCRSGYHTGHLFLFSLVPL